jgi:hypothetical protein
MITVNCRCGWTPPYFWLAALALAPRRGSRLEHSDSIEGSRWTMVCLLNESLPAILSKRPGSDSLASLGNHSNEPSERYGRAIFGEPAGRFPFLSPGRPLNPASAPHRSPASSRCAPVEGAALALLPFDEDVIRFICVTVSAVIVFELRIGTCIIGRTSDENSKLDVGPP